jgi:hypothetical protein
MTPLVAEFGQKKRRFVQKTAIDGSDWTKNLEGELELRHKHQ